VTTNEDTRLLTDDVVVTKALMGPEWGIWALVYMQVCAHGECPPELIEQRANELNPPGSSAPWRLSTEGPDGQDLSPVQCAQDPARLHHMLSC
jgi:hypothetical protein